jgi:hypothetical protein
MTTSRSSPSTRLITNAPPTMAAAPAIRRPTVGIARVGVPADQRLPHAISFGYPAAADAAQAPPKKGGRAPFEDVVRWERW